MRQLQIEYSLTNRDEIFTRYAHDVSKYPTITIAEEIELSRKIRKGGIEAEKARNKLVEANLRFVISVAKQYVNRGVPLMDLINEGNFGLIKAAEKYDESLGFKFISYAIWWIRQSITVCLQESRIVHLPCNKINLLTKINEQVNEFILLNERMPNMSEISDILNISEKKVSEVMNEDGHHMSINTPLYSDDDDFTFESTLIGDLGIKETGDDDILYFLKKRLSKREYHILYNVLFLERTYKDVGEDLNLSAERTRQIYYETIDKLKTIIKKYYD